MYTPKIFTQDDEQSLFDLLEDYPLATVVTLEPDVLPTGSLPDSQQTGQLQASHVPLCLLKQTTGSYLLQGHIAKANSLWRNVVEPLSVLAIFQGPQCYITPNWYPTKQQHGKAVPTWNYSCVHMSGSMRFVHDDEWKMTMLEQITAANESTEPQPWSIHDAPTDYINKLLNAIVGLEITVNKVEATWKLSQNQPAENYAGVLEGLATSDKLGTDDMLAFMQKYKPKTST